MNTSNDVDYLLRRAQQEARKAREALERGDNLKAIYAHRELATRYQATAASLMRANRLH